MATLAQIYNARNSNELKTKVESAILVASGDIKNEDVATPNHTARLALAKKCMTNQEYLNETTLFMMYPIGTNATIAGDLSNATDNDIQYVVNSNITEIALLNPPA